MTTYKFSLKQKVIINDYRGKFMKGTVVKRFADSSYGKKGERCYTINLDEYHLLGSEGWTRDEYEIQAVEDLEPFQGEFTFEI